MICGSADKTDNIKIPVATISPLAHAITGLRQIGHILGAIFSRPNWEDIIIIEKQLAIGIKRLLRDLESGVLFRISKPTQVIYNSHGTSQLIMSPKRLHYHTYEHFLDSGMRSFLEHAAEYLKHQTTVPVGRTRHERAQRFVYFTFSDRLMIMFFEDPALLKKSYEAAILYGFRGHSLGHKNGIFYIAKRDLRMAAAVDRLSLRNRSAIEQDLEIQRHAFDTLKKVKIVCHETSGKRVVGLFNERNSRMIFLGIARYQ